MSILAVRYRSTDYGSDNLASVSVVVRPYMLRSIFVFSLVLYLLRTGLDLLGYMPYAWLCTQVQESRIRKTDIPLLLFGPANN